MATVPQEEIPFTEDDLDGIHDRMAAMVGSGTGWINFLPEVVDDATVPASGGLFAIFTARGPAVPMATWKPAPPDQPERMTLGIEHGSGPQALNRLRQMQLGLPAGWRKVADHPKRGLVVTAPGDAPVADVLWWLLAASHALSTAPLTGDWLARAYG
jgi:hypothetical protein